MTTKAMVANQKVSKKGYVYAEKRSKVCVQGRNANFSGKTLEKSIEEILVAKGAYPINYSSWVNDKVTVPGWAKSVLYKQVNYTKPWGSNGYSDFVLETKNRSIRIDARYQGVSGSVDEKANFLFDTAERCYPEKEVIIVLDGPGVNPKIRTWLIDRATSVKHKSISIMTKAEFRNWVSTNL